MVDAFLPALSAEQAQEIIQQQGDITDQRREAIRRFLMETPSQSQAFRETLDDALKNRLTEKGCGDVKQFVDILNYSIPAFLLTGSTTPFASLSPEQAETTIQQLYNSRIPTIRFGIKTVGGILRALYLRSEPLVSQAVGFPGLPAVPEEQQKRADSPADRFKARREAFFARGKTERRAEGDVLVWETNVLVIGTGSGATSLVGSLAKELEGSHQPGTNTQHPSIIMLEKGDYFAPHELEKTENDSFKRMYEGAGVLGSEEGAISIFAGATVGGGSKINWSATLQTDRKVRAEWTKLTAVGGKDAKRLSQGGSGEEEEAFRTMFLGKEWQDCMDEVCKILHVKTPEEQDHNVGNLTLLEGARRLGYVCKPVPQNITGTFAAHKECGASCTAGCRGSGEADDKKTGRSGKMSGERAFLDEYLQLDPESGGATRGGVTVEIMDKFEVDRVVFEQGSSARASGAVKKAVGVVGTVKGSDGVSYKAFIKANRVVVAAGTLNSPCVLLRSGLKNPTIGKNLYLHPTCIVLSEWDTEVRPWEGNILTTVINEFSDLDGQGHGVKLEGMDMLPGISMSFAPWNSGAEYKSRLLRYPHTQGHIVLCREKNPGRVRVDAKTGKLLIDYTPSVLDRKHLLEGILEMCKVLYTMGAKEISTATAGAPTWRRDDTAASANQQKRPADGWAADPRFLEFLAALNARGLPLDLATFGSAHQMGTCRMGSSPSHSVVDQRGRVWGCEGLYVADASVFPSASGVNPMLTTMAFGRWIGRRLAEEVKLESGLSIRKDVNSKL
ncbi:hypothetical protein QFC22_005804 [Naganishia vaughanmartiniae]|uniref:Uncharacterized protein n=1 Tax=Naganishia vaughanmartiniae TaxID=1424756 RepID=A0ACC2WSA9_9TREE|nr:hypothetical protein QFC22_005804 [Naganishia vaughanmartiniae]